MSTNDQEERLPLPHPQNHLHSVMPILSYGQQEENQQWSLQQRVEQREHQKPELQYQQPQHPGQSLRVIQEKMKFNRQMIQQIEQYQWRYQFQLVHNSHQLSGIDHQFHKMILNDKAKCHHSHEVQRRLWEQVTLSTDRGSDPAKPALTEFTYFPQLPPELKYRIWEMYREDYAGTRHYFDLRPLSNRSVLRAYGAYCPHRHVFYHNLGRKNRVDPRNMVEASIDPRMPLRLISKTHTPPLETPSVNFRDASKWTRWGNRSVDSRLYLLADMDRDVFIFNSSSVLFANPAPSDKGPYWTYGLKKFALGAFRVPEQNIPAITGGSYDQLTSLQVLYLIVASNPTCLHGRPHTWPGIEINEDGFIIIDEFISKHPYEPYDPHTRRAACMCDLYYNKFNRQHPCVQFLEHAFRAGGVNVDIQLVVDPYMG
jgi:hypothetical protein